MPVRTLLSAFVACLMMAMTSTVSVAADLPRWTVGVVLDGPWQRTRQLNALELMKREILLLTDGEFAVSFPTDKQLDGNWTLDGVNRALDQLLNDPQVDLVLALGVAASGEVARRSNLPKPVMAPIIIGLQPGLPFKNGVSGKKNLNYLYSFNKTPSDVLLLHELQPFKRLAFIMEPLTAKVLQRYDMDKLLGQIPAEELYIIPAEGTPEDVISKIPPDADAAIFGAIFQWDEATTERMARLLIERKLPSLSIMGGWEVEAGFLAATTTDSDVLRLIRRIAINVQRILLGEDPGKIEVEFRETVRPIINMQTAHALGISPTYDLLNSSDLIGDPDTADYEPLTFREAVLEALEQNLGLETSAAGLRVDVEDIARARADLLPGLEASLGARQIDRDRAISFGGNNPEYLTTANLTLSQLIYAEPAWANQKIQQLLQQAREHEYEAKVLDIALDTSLSYLNLLRAQQLAGIRKEDLAFTKSNLERARTRVQLGAANRSEEYRWESQLAGAHAQLVNASVSISQARVNLSRLVSRALETRYRTVNPTLEDPHFLVSHKRFLQYITTPAAVRVLREFLVLEGLQNAPELRRLEDAIAAQERAVESARNVFTHPTVGFQAEVNEVLARRGAGLNPEPVTIPGIGTFPGQKTDVDNTLWQMGVSATLPLYQGGARSSDVRRNVAELSRLQQQRDELREGLQAQILVTVYGAGGAFSNIQFAQQRDEAASNNLDLVTDAYSRGAVSIIELLDAQNAAVTARSASANAVFDFLIEFMRLQRAMGAFDFLMSEKQRRTIYDRMDAFFAERGITPATLDPT